MPVLMSLLAEAIRSSNLTYEQVLQMSPPHKQTPESFLRTVLDTNDRRFLAVEKGLRVEFKFTLVSAELEPKPSLAADVNRIIRLKSGTLTEAAKLIDPYWREKFQGRGSAAQGMLCRQLMMRWMSSSYRAGATGYNLSWVEGLFHRAHYRLTVSVVDAHRVRSQPQGIGSTLSQLLQTAEQQLRTGQDRLRVLAALGYPHEWERVAPGVAGNEAMFKRIELALNMKFTFAMQRTQGKEDIGWFIRETKSLILSRHTRKAVGEAVGMRENGKPLANNWLAGWANETGYREDCCTRLTWLGKLFHLLGYRLMIWNESDDQSPLVLVPDATDEPSAGLSGTSTSEPKRASDAEEGSPTLVPLDASWEFAPHNLVMVRFSAESDWQICSPADVTKVIRNAGGKIECQFVQGGSSIPR